MQYFTPHCVPVTWQSLALTGVGDNVPTTVVDLTGDEPEILREGKGELQ